MKKLFHAFATVLLVLNLTSTAWCSSYSYDIIDIGALLGGGNSSAVAVNNNGQVIGQVGLGVNTTAFLYGDGATSNLGAVTVHGINNLGQIVGEGASGPFVYSGGLMNILGGDTRTANDINDLGQVVGYGNYVVDGLGHKADRAYIYHDGSFSVLGTLLPTDPLSTSYAYSINNNGQVVGNASNVSRTTNTAYIYKDATMTNLGTLGGATSNAIAINDDEQILGLAATLASGNHAFLYDEGMTDLSAVSFDGCTATNAYDINNRGQLVGKAIGTSGGSAGFVYDGTQMRNLNLLTNPSLTYNISSASGINDFGQIAATGKPSSSFYPHALLLTPTLRTWDGGGADDNWSTPQNWDNDILPVNGCAITFSGLSRQINIRDSNNGYLTSVGRITFANGGFVINGNDLRLNAGIDNTGNNAWAINSTLAIVQSFTSLSGTLTISGNVNNNSNLLTLAGPGDHLISGAISGLGGLTKSGSGTATLSNTNNDYKGDTIVTGGILAFAGGIQANSTPIIDVQGGTAVLKTTYVNNPMLNIETITGATFEVDDGIHAVGIIDGSGITNVVAGGLTATSINQDTLSIGTGATFTIAPVSGGPLAGNSQLTSVPEPGLLLLVISGVVCLLFKRLHQ